MTDQEQQYNERHKPFHDEIRDNRKKFVESTTLNIDRQLQYDALNGNGDKATLLLHALSTGTPFMLYQDQTHSAVIIPKLRIIVRMYGRGRFTTELLDEIRFQDQVKYLYIVFPSFDIAAPEIVKAALQIFVSNSKLISPTKAYR